MSKPNPNNRLLEQQFWCWGHDVRHRPNLLLTYGFSRVPPPPPARERGAISRYEMTSNEVTIVIWGWGILYCRPELGAVFIARQAMIPLTPNTEKLMQAWLPVKVPHVPLAPDEASYELFPEAVMDRRIRRLGL